MNVLLIIIQSIGVVIAIAILYRTIGSVRRYAITSNGDPLITEIPKQDTPSVSVCIAARNEMHALAHCLENVIKSDYPKLEVLVLDDSSSDDTSLIIKSFAHAGVRFVPGKPLPDGWLGKNHAYHTLIHESSGDILVFIDVDTSIGTTTISRLVGELQAQGDDMISVLPQRASRFSLSSIAGTLRYLWELIIATDAVPPASSALWAVRRVAFEKLSEDLSRYRQSVRPERHLAKRLAAAHKYRYVISTRVLSVTYEKRLASQYETALRLYFPVVGRRFIGVIGGLAVTLNAPIAVGILLTYGDTAHAVLAVLTIIASVSTVFIFTIITSSTYQLSILRLVVAPFLLLQEAILLVASVSGYVRGTITWKGRRLKSQPSNRDSIELNA